MPLLISKKKRTFSTIVIEKLLANCDVGNSVNSSSSNFFVSSKAKIPLLMSRKKGLSQLFVIEKLLVNCDVGNSV